MTVDELIKRLKELKKQGHGSRQVFSEEDGRLIYVNSAYKGYADRIVLSADESVTKE